MLESLASLAAHKAGAASTTPLRAAAGSPFWLEWLRERNSALDGFFYDVGKVTPAEASLLGPFSAREGAILIVPPGGGAPLTVCTSVPDFLNKGGAAVRSLAIAGVGSSALGTAAFARNIADATGAPVAGIVSGYGMADVLAEGLGGYFWFGALNRLRNRVAQLGRAAEAVPGLGAPAATGRWGVEISAQGGGTATAALRTPTLPAIDPLARGDDMLVLLDLLASPEMRFTLMTGHSKGNLVLAEALHQNAALARREGRTVDGEPLIVTFSAAIAVPSLYGNIVDVLGGLDGFGLMNSTPGVRIERRPPGTGHHTNTDIPGHLPVTSILKDILADRPALSRRALRAARVS